MPGTTIWSVGQRLKKHKIPREDDKYSEIPWLHQIVQQVCKSKAMPDDWSEAVIIPSFKMGDKRQCSCLRNISFSDIASKVYVTLLLRRFQTARNLR